MASKLIRFEGKKIPGNFGYSIHIHNGRKLMNYSGVGSASPYGKHIGDLNTARMIACVLLPRDSATRYVIIYKDGTTTGRLFRQNGHYLYRPAYFNGLNEYKDMLYEINPNSGRVIGKKFSVWTTKGL